MMSPRKRVGKFEQRLLIHGARGIVSISLLVIAHFPGLLCAALLARAFRGTELAPVFVVLAVLSLLSLGSWRERVYAWISGRDIGRLLSK